MSFPSSFAATSTTDGGAPLDSLTAHLEDEGLLPRLPPLSDVGPASEAAGWSRSVVGALRSVAVVAAAAGGRGGASSGGDDGADASTTAGKVDAVRDYLSQTFGSARADEMLRTDGDAAADAKAAVDEQTRLLHAGCANLPHVLTYFEARSVVAILERAVGTGTNATGEDAEGSSSDDAALDEWRSVLDEYRRENRHLRLSASQLRLACRFDVPNLRRSIDDDCKARESLESDVERLERDRLLVSSKVEALCGGLGLDVRLGDASSSCDASALEEELSAIARRDLPNLCRDVEERCRSTRDGVEYYVRFCAFVGATVSGGGGGRGGDGGAAADDKNDVEDSERVVIPTLRGVAGEAPSLTNESAVDGAMESGNGQSVLLSLSTRGALVQDLRELRGFLNIRLEEMGEGSGSGGDRRRKRKGGATALGGLVLDVAPSSSSGASSTSAMPQRTARELQGYKLAAEAALSILTTGTLASLALVADCPARRVRLASRIVRDRSRVDELTESVDGAKARRDEMGRRMAAKEEDLSRLGARVNALEGALEEEIAALFAERKGTGKM